MDISWRTDRGRFNFRVCAIFLHQGKILAMQDERLPYYYLPGGRVGLHEPMEQAVVREVREELELECSIARPLWLNQGFFTEDVSGERFHEVCLYYLMDTPEALLAKGTRFTLHEGRHTHVFEWLPVDSLRERYFYPLFLKEKIFHLPEHLTILTEIED